MRPQRIAAEYPTRAQLDAGLPAASMRPQRIAAEYQLRRLVRRGRSDASMMPQRIAEEFPPMRIRPERFNLRFNEAAANRCGIRGCATTGVPPVQRLQ